MSLIHRIFVRKTVQVEAADQPSRRSRTSFKEAEEDNEKPEETLPEPPSSWHHAARLKVLSRNSTTWIRVSWFASSIALVVVQMMVLLSFLSAMSAKRCIVHDDCDDSLYCAGLQFGGLHIRDPLDSSLTITRGVCMGCSTRMPDDKHVDGLLETLCPGAGGASDNSSVGLLCMQGCMSACTQGTIALGSKHFDKYTPAERVCASDCTLSCARTLDGPLARVFDEAARGSSWRTGDDSTVAAYGVWLSVHAQCSECPASVREGVRFSTPAERENLSILKMSFFDFVSLGLAALIVALTCSREVRDMNIGAMMTLQAVLRDADRARKGAAAEEMELCEFSEAWRWGLGFQTFVRRYMILPDVAMVVVLMVARMGGDTVSIMLNTLAALFMLELDNLAFDFGLTAGCKADVEARFKVELGARQLRLLNWSRRWHTIFLTIWLLVMTAILPLIPTIWDRMRVMGCTVLIIVALGEIIELVLRFKLRSRRANRDRIGFFVIKVTCAFFFKWYIVEMMSHFSEAASPLDWGLGA